MDILLLIGPKEIIMESILYSWSLKSAKKSTNSNRLCILYVDNQASTMLQSISSMNHSKIQDKLWDWTGTILILTMHEFFSVSDYTTTQNW